MCSVGVIYTVLGKHSNRLSYFSMVDRHLENSIVLQSYNAKERNIVFYFQIAWYLGAF